jgi:hypothetical protein
MPKRPLKFAMPDLEKFLDLTHKGTLIQMQSELGNARVSPVDTGRFKSSWFAKADSKSDAFTPEQARSNYRINRDAVDLRLDYKATYFLSNNLDYAEPVVGGRVVSKSPGWFNSFLGNRYPKIVDAAVRAAKKKI